LSEAKGDVISQIGEAIFTPETPVAASAIYRLKPRIRFVLSDKIARQKTRFLPCSRRPAARPVRCSICIFK
jgi:hypothetical protein